VTAFSSGAVSNGNISLLVESFPAATDFLFDAIWGAELRPAIINRKPRALYLAAAEAFDLPPEACNDWLRRIARPCARGGLRPSHRGMSRAPTNMGRAAPARDGSKFLRSISPPPDLLDLWVFQDPIPIAWNLLASRIAP